MLDVIFGSRRRCQVSAHMLPKPRLATSHASSAARVALGAALYCLVASTLPAEELTFTLDPAASQVTVSGRIVPIQANTDPQGPGSDVTSYSGTFFVDVDDRLAPTSIEFLGGTATAADSGDWLPQIGGGDNGTFLPGDADPGIAQPANYGLEATGLGIGSLWVAFRDLGLSPTSEPLSITDGTFTTEQNLTLTAGSADYTVRSIIFSDMNDHIDLVGKTEVNLAEGAGHYMVENGLATLMLPVELFVEVEDEETGFTVLELTFAGSVTATAPVGPSPTADFDGDGDVDGDDLMDMLLGVGTTDATRSDGDADSDGDVDRQDLQVWRDQVDAGASRASAVPEPTSLLLGYIAAMSLLAAERIRAAGVSVQSKRPPVRPGR
jgi:hypothetical protein